MLRPIGREQDSTRFFRSLGVLATAVSAGLLLLAGCSSDTGGGDSPQATDASVDSPPAQVAVADQDPQPADVPEQPQETPAATVPESEDADLASATDPGVPRLKLKPDVVLMRPEVLLSAGHQAICVAAVGDVMPSLALTDTTGNAQSLSPLLGRKLTVVVFWRLAQPYAKEQIERLSREVVDPFGAYGVNAVTINVGDLAPEVQAAGQSLAATFPMLLDVDGTALAAVGAAKLPRTYLLDPAGRILWFDIEYSESTRRELKNAIRWYLTRGPSLATSAGRPR